MNEKEALEKLQAIANQPKYSLKRFLAQEILTYDSPQEFFSLVKEFGMETLYYYEDLEEEEIREILRKYPDCNQLCLKDILDFYRLKDPLVKKATVQWRVTRLLELGITQRIGRGKYTTGKYRKFIPYPTSQIEKAHHHLINKFPDSKYCIWSIEWLKTYPTKLDVQIVFVEGTGNEPINFYFHLWEQRYCSVYYGLQDKVSKMFYKNSIIVRKMISESPLIELEGIFFAHLEKIIVDLYYD